MLLTTDPKVYKELLTHHWRGTNGDSEPHPRWCLDWIWWFWNLWRLELILSTLLGFLEYWSIYRIKRGFRTQPRWAQPTKGCLGLQARPSGLCSPRSTPRCSLGPLGVFWSNKFSVKFRCIWTPFGIDFLRYKKHAENSNWHLAIRQ